MNGDDDVVLRYLASYPNAWVSAAEVSKRADGRQRFNDDPHWARPTLQKLTMQKVLEVDSRGCYRIPPKVEEEEEDKRPYVPRPDDVIAAPPAESPQQPENVEPIKPPTAPPLPPAQAA